MGHQSPFDAGRVPKHLTIRGERIAFLLVGRGLPVLLIHSLGTSSALWHSTLAASAPTRTAVARDCRGHGASTNHGGFSLTAVAQDALNLMTALGFERFAYVGISMGGLIGVTLNSLAPQRVRAIVLADSYASVGAAGPARLEATRTALAVTPMADFARTYVAQTLRNATAPEVHTEITSIIASVTMDTYLQAVEAILPADVSALLPLVKCPTLVMVGDEDQRTPASMSQVLVDGIDGAKLIVVPAAGHLAVLDNPGVFDSTLVRFLEAVGTPCRPCLRPARPAGRSASDRGRRVSRVA